MIDPFGVSDTPMNTVGRILSNPKSEVYVSFMSRDVNRFREHTNFERHLDDLFGCRDWREGIDLPEGKERIAFFYDLYKSQLKAAGAKYVLHFELYEGNESGLCNLFRNREPRRLRQDEASDLEGRAIRRLSLSRK